MVASDDVVFLRSEDDRGGDSGCFLLDEFRESHEKGLVSFLEGGAGVGNEVCFSFSVAGGATEGEGDLTGDMLPEPCGALAESKEGNFGRRSDCFAPSTYLSASCFFFFFSSSSSSSSSGFQATAL